MTDTERADLASTLDLHRTMLLKTADGLSEEQARSSTTVSTLSVASILKHVAETEQRWMSFAQRGAEAFAEEEEVAVEDDLDDQEPVDHSFDLQGNDNLGDLRDRLLSVGAETSRLLAVLDLDSSNPLPDAPWFEAGASWSARRVALHLIAEIAQHAGHADIIRETIDGAKSMG